MPKSKYQKQQEAIARNRAAFPEVIKDWCSRQPGGEQYEQRLQDHGEDWAQEGARLASEQLGRAAVAAHVDCHGNPLKD